jgi:hypothetical protein
MQASAWQLRVVRKRNHRRIRGSFPIPASVVDLVEVRAVEEPVVVAGRAKDEEAVAAVAEEAAGDDDLCRKRQGRYR